MRKEVVLTEFNAKDIKTLTGKLPSRIVKHWKKNKSMLGYASFRGLSEKDMKIIFGHSRGINKPPKVTLGVSRMGNISGYKLKEII